MWGILINGAFKKRFKDRDFLCNTSGLDRIFLIFAQNYKHMKKTLFTLLLAFLTNLVFADSILIESFEYANHDLEKPVGWICDDNSWLCGYMEKDHNRIPHSGNWYAFSDSDDAWMFMPLYLISSMNYRFSCWTISEGEYQLEFCAGPVPNPENMHTQLFTTNVSGGIYEKVSAYIDVIPQGCEYIAIHAIACQNATHLTIDDIDIDMVEQYAFEAEPITGDTAMYPGSQAIFHFLVHNTGYDPVDITAHPTNEFFTNISCYVNGVSGMTFPTQPDETIEVTTYATLRPEIEPGTVTWLDIMMTIPCGCNTAMVTFWVTPLDPTKVAENQQSVNIFPNPAIDFVTVEADGLQTVFLTDLKGKTLSSHAAKGNSVLIDVSGLKAGVYLISAKTRSTSSFVKPILKM